MAEHTLRLVSGSAPRRRGPVVPSGILAMMVVVAVESMIFAGLVSAEIVVKATAKTWPPPGEPLLPTHETLFNTGALLLSGVVLWLALRIFKTDPQRARGPLVATLLLGTFFVVFQGVEWVALLRQGLTLTSSTLGSFFYLIIGLHGLHAVIAIAALGFMVVRLFQDRLPANHLQTVSVFWFFVVGLWPFLYWQIYP